jgi:hypothetical protein
MSATTYPCALCGKRAKAETMTYSRWTRNRYCLDWKECERRAKRRHRHLAAGLSK